MIQRLRDLLGISPAPTAQIELHTYSEQGGSHAENEDALAAQQHDRDPAVWLCCLADGQGGQVGGARAAQLAVQTTISAALAQPPRSLLKPRSCQELVRLADRAVADDPQAGFTTLIVLAATDRLIYGASCGDSAAALFEADQAVVLTEDQLPHPPVGSRSARPTSFHLELEPPWKLCVMSDGVWKYVGLERVVALMRRHAGRELAETLRATLRGRAGLPDDFSIVSLTCDTPVR